MARNQIPGKWNTERLRVADSVPEEAPELQQINDLVPETQSWMQVEGADNPDGSMLIALKEGVLPPTPDRSKEYFRLQSVRTASTGELIGFFGVYHGFPEPDILWINTLTFHPDYQGKGYGPELMKGLIEIVKQSGGYTRIQSYVCLKNWPSLRFCVKAGLNKMVGIAGDKVYTAEGEAHILVEKTLAEDGLYLGRAS